MCAGWECRGETLYLMFGFGGGGSGANERFIDRNITSVP